MDIVAKIRRQCIIIYWVWRMFPVMRRAVFVWGFYPPYTKESLLEFMDCHYPKEANELRNAMVQISITRTSHPDPQPTSIQQQKEDKL